MGKRIVDRDFESKKIYDLFENKQYNVFFIYSKTGVGKSTLTNELSNNYLKTKNIINIKTTPKNNSSKDNEGEFISFIFNAFIKSSYKQKKEFKKRTFEYFLKKNKLIKKKSLEKMVNDIDYNSIKKTTLWSIFKHFLNKVFKIYEYNQDSYFTLKDKDAFLIAYNYINYVLSFGDVLWSIDNFQNIDLYSSQLLSEIISLQPKTNITIIEYTVVNSEDYTKLIKLDSNYRCLNINSILFELPNMDYSNINEILDKINTNNTLIESMFLYDAKQYYLEESDGNLYKLIQYKITYNNRDYSDPIMKKINSLTIDQKYIIYIITLSGGKIAKFQLDNIINRSKGIIIFNYNEQYSDLINSYHLIQENNNFVSFVHASILDVINKYANSKNHQILLAYKNILDYHLVKINSETIDYDNKFESINLILNLVFKYNPNEIITYLKNIIPYLYEKISPLSLMKYINKYIEYIQDDFDNKITDLHFLVKFCFDYCLYNECLYIIDRIKSKSLTYSELIINVYEMNAKEYLEKHEEVIQRCEEFLKENISDKEKYIYFLLLIGSYRSLNRKDKSKIYADKIKQINNYKSYKEYGIYLRLTETYMHRQDALPHLEKSINHFIKHKDYFNEIKSCITYSFLLAVTKDIKSAKKELEIAIKKSKKYNFYNFNVVFLLNQAVLEILNNNFDLSIDDELHQAEISTSSPYDKLLIITLRLINSVECNYHSIIPTLILKINELIQYETDKHLLALVMYDLYLYYSIINDEDLKNKFYKLAKNYSSYNTSVQYKLQNRINRKTPTLFNTKWAIGFTFFWNVDI